MPAPDRPIDEARAIIVSANLRHNRGADRSAELAVRQACQVTQKENGLFGGNKNRYQTKFYMRVHDIRLLLYVGREN